MHALLLSLAVVVGAVTLSTPGVNAVTCENMAQCVKFFVSGCEDDGSRVVCMKWAPSLPGCDHSSGISKVPLYCVYGKPATRFWAPYGKEAVVCQRRFDTQAYFQLWGDTDCTNRQSWKSTAEAKTTSMDTFCRPLDPNVEDDGLCEAPQHSYRRRLGGHAYGYDTYQKPLPVACLWGLRFNQCDTRPVTAKPTVARTQPPTAAPTVLVTLITAPPTPAPTVTTPAPTPQVTVTTPAPTPQATVITPAPTPQVTVTTPAPTPQATVITPAPTPQATVITPAPTPQATVITPAPTPQATVTTPAPTPAPMAPPPSATCEDGLTLFLPFAAFSAGGIDMLTRVDCLGIPSGSTVPTEIGLYTNLNFLE
jgi:hypothetical protein